MNMKLLLVAAFLGFAGIGYGDPLRLDTDKAKAGQKVSFSYNAGLGKLSGATELRAVLFYYTATKGAGYYAEDCSLKPVGKDQWKGSFVVPDSAIAWALRFRSGKLTEDNGGTGYIAPVYDKSGVRPEAYAGMALLYANGESMLAIGNRSDTGMVLLEKEFSLHPDVRSKYEGAWYNMLVNTKKQDAYPVLEARIQGLMAVPAPSLADYQLAMRLYQLQKKKKQADSIIAIAAVRYPGSVMAVQYADNSFYKIRDIDSMITAYENFMTQYGHTAPLDPATQVSDFFASSISQKYIQQKKYRAAIVYASKMTDAMADYRGYMYSWVAIDLVRADSALALADSLVGIALAGLDHEQAHPELFRKAWIGVADWKADMDRYYRSAFYDTYGRVLFAQGDASKAVTAQLRSVTLAKGENNGFNEHYVKYLLRSGDVKAARERAATYIRSNTASDSVKIWFKEIYVKENGSDKGYAEYVAGLQQSATAKFRETALKEKLDLPMKAFSLRGLDGKEVSLVSLRGKVVVVDFWATWCGPCKASFPAMQTAVDKYRSDSNVVFLFVDTWESLTEEQRYAQVKKFIADNKYRFHVLFDSVVDLEKRQYSVVSDYGVGGIPTKFVLDRDGRIVFKAVGFDGNNEKLVTELSVYIDLAKG